MSDRKSFFRHGMAKWGLFMGALFALWFGGWLAVANWADGKIGDVITQLDKRNISISCSDREVRGFPFRLGIYCNDAGVNDQVHQFSVQTGTVRSAAQIYAPKKNVVEIDGPFTFDNPAVSLNANWELMRLYVEVERGGFDLLSSNFTKLEGTFNDLLFGSSKGEAHLRPTPPKPEQTGGTGIDLDVASTLEGVVFDGSTETKADLVVDVTVERGYGDFIVKRRALNDWLADGARVEVRTLGLTTPGGGGLALAGPLQIHADGTASGDVKVGVDNLEELARWVTEVNPEFGPMITALGQGVSLLGRDEELSGRKMKVLDVKLVRGQASVAGLNIGVIPPFVMN